MRASSHRLTATLLLTTLAAGAPAAQRAQPVTRQQFDAWMKQISNWGRWGKEDELGTLNLITPEKRKAAAGLVREGVSVSLALDLNKERDANNGSPFEHQLSLIKLTTLRTRETSDEHRRRMEALRASLVEIDATIAPLARKGSELVNSRWGLLMRTGNDKSHLAKQVERYADIYMSRVSNFLFHTPFVYLRSPRTSLPHDMD